MIAHVCGSCSRSNAIVNQCGCDPNNLPTRPGTLGDAIACAEHYLDEILEYIADHGQAPERLDRYTCGREYGHEAEIDYALFACIVGRINSFSGRLAGEQLREVSQLAIGSFK